MVIDELVARLRFQVEGLKNLLAGKKAIDSTTKSIVTNAAAANAAGGSIRGHANAMATSAAATSALQGRTTRLTSALLLLRSASRVAFVGFASGLAMIIKALGVAVTRVAKLGAALGLALGAGKLAAAVGGLAAVLGQAAGAVAGRRTQLDAAEAGTTKGKREALANFLSIETGLQGDDFAEKITSAVGAALLDVRKGGEGRADAIQNFGRAGIALTDDKTGLARDSTAVAMDLMRRAIDFRNERDGAKTKKGRVAADSKLASLADLGLTPAFVEALSNIKDFGGFLDRFNAAQKDVPPQTDKQKTEEQRLAEEMGKTAAAARGLGDAISSSIGEALRQFGPSLNDVNSALQAATEAVKSFRGQVAAFAANPLRYASQKVLEATGVAKPDQTAPGGVTFGRTSFGEMQDSIRDEKLARKAAKVAGREANLNAETDRKRSIVEDFGRRMPKVEGAGEFADFMRTLNRQAVEGLNRDFGLGGRGDPQKVEATADVQVKSDVSVRVEPSSELLKVVATAKSAGAQVGAMIAKSANTATVGATAP
jgi:hypothetical protein